MICQGKLASLGKQLVLFGAITIPAGVALSSRVALSQEATLPVPANLRLDGVPRVPLTLVDSTAVYRNYRGASFEDWHPQQRTMAITTDFSDSPQLHLVETPKGARRQLTYFADGVFGARFEAGDGDSIVFMKDTDGDERYQLYRYEMETGNIRLLTDGRSRNFLGPWSSRGDRIAYTSTRRTGRDTDLWVRSPEDARSNRLLTQLTGDGWKAMDWSRDDKSILLLEEISTAESYLWMAEMATGRKSAITGRAEGCKSAYREARFSRDGKSVFAITNKDSEFFRLANVDLSSGTMKFLTDDGPWDVDQFELSADGSRLAFTTDQEAASKLQVLATAGAKESATPTLPVGLITGLRWQKNGQEVGFTLNRPRTPPDAYSWRPGSETPERWTFSESALRTEGFSEPELVKWSSFDDKHISGLLYHPLAKFWGKRPVIIVIHDGPEEQAHPVFLGRQNYFLNELGVALLFPNVRGSMGYGKSFAEADDGQKREGSYKDIIALLDWIKTRPDLDADRVAIEGLGYGSNVALAVAAISGGRIRCTIDISGMASLATFLSNQALWRREMLRAEYGDERDEKTLEFLETISPVKDATKIKSPVFVVAGKNDPYVTVDQSEALVTSLRKGGATAWYLSAEDEGHGFRKRANQDFLFYETVLFIESYLLR